MSLGLAVRAFFLVLFSRDVAERVRAALKLPESSPVPAIEKQPPPSPTAPLKPSATPPKRSDSLTLLSALQREARLIDLVMEPLDAYEDAQIGAAAREVLRDCQKALGRLFAIEPLAKAAEGETLEIPESPSPAMYRLTGAVGAKSTRGTITHRGWQATKCEVPKWTGTTSEANLLAPIEVELQ